MEAGAGKNSQFSDESYTQSGAKIVSAEEVYQSDIILKVRAPQVQSRNQTH